MSEAPRLYDYLGHMRAAAEQTLAYTSAMDRTQFEADTRTQQAVLFNLIVLGEASAKVMDGHAEFIDRHPDVPWRAIRNMRNHVAHGYFKVDLDVVWKTVKTALPPLLAGLATAMADTRSGHDGSDLSAEPT